MLTNLPLSSYSTTTTNDGSYLKLTGGTITGDLLFNKVNLNIQSTATHGKNIAIPSTAVYFSTSAEANDMVTRSIDNLMFLAGNTGGTAAIYINTAHKVGFGTNNPQQILDVYTDNASIDNFSRVRANTAREAGITFDGNGTIWSIFNKGTGFTGSIYNLYFQSRSESLALEITQSGNVTVSGTLTVGSTLTLLFDTWQKSSNGVDRIYTNNGTT